MHVRLPTLMLSAGVLLLLAAGLAPAAPTAERVLRLNVSDTEVNYLDPALNYDFIGWRLEYTTCTRLLTYPDKRGRAGTLLTPENATSFPRVSRDGKTYTFTVRSGFRFSDGRPVTADSFARAIDRGMSPKLQSYAAPFLADVAGIKAVQAGKRTRAAGVTVTGNRLSIRLTKVAPDFIARLAMPFFCSVPPDFPFTVDNKPPGAGPYYDASFVPSREIVLKRNPYYGGMRPQRWDEMRIALTVPVNASYLQVRKGEADYDMAALPPSAHAQLASKYGINKGRYFVNPINGIIYIALNTSRPFFKDAATRRAVSFAVDRVALNRVGGPYYAKTNDQLLPPGIPGYVPARIYPDRANVARAKQLLNGKTGSVVLYSGNDPVSTNQSQVIQANLKAIGIDVKIRTFTFATQIEKTGRQTEPFDMNLIGWFADYPDPYDFINILLYGKTIGPKNNVNTAYFNDPEYNRKMEEASRLRGDARYRVYGALDVDITRNAAPFVVFGNINVREFVSERIGCPMYSSAWGGLNLVMLCLKD
jgi:peptide/nickel transport system substrate-binding protein